MNSSKWILVAAILLSFSCGQKDKKVDREPDKTFVKQNIGVNEKLTAADFNAKIKYDTVQLIDVRSPEEFLEGHLKNAKNINFYDGDFMQQMLKELDESKPVYLYCKSGGRSGKAAAKLSERGFKIYDLKGGILDWKANEFEVISE
ncbi:MAG: rhodanese-like domain-containing protein [Flavobacteriaceae bacterium]|nr:rhodanese-like domain-containing protein [Flavobacteriaceae bacterium]